MAFFLMLQQHPDVMRYIDLLRPEEEIYRAFARMDAWRSGSPGRGITTGYLACCARNMAKSADLPASLCAFCQA